MVLLIDDIKKMSKNQLEAELSNRVYAAALLLEQMEHAGLIFGNGHHKAQRIAKCAVEEMRTSWKQKLYDKR